MDDNKDCKKEIELKDEQEEISNKVIEETAIDMNIIDNEELGTEGQNVRIIGMVIV